MHVFYAHVHRPVFLCVQNHLALQWKRGFCCGGMIVSRTYLRLLPHSQDIYYYYIHKQFLFIMFCNFCNDMHSTNCLPIYYLHFAKKILIVVNSEICHLNIIMSNLLLAVKMKNILKSVHLSVPIISAHCNDNEIKL